MLITKYIRYLGIRDPNTEQQIKVEIDGLKHAIAVAQENIAKLEQSLSIAILHKEENVEGGE